jgi:hypothetical protein
MTCQEQLDEWVKGNSIHDVERGECCPDFSCCRPELLASQVERLTFNEHPELRDRMLMKFLGAALKKMEFEVISSEDIEPGLGSCTSP